MRSKFFLIVSILVILVVNSLLPTLKATSHYTENAVEMTYLEYKTLRATNQKYDLTLKTKMVIKAYRETLKEELTPEEFLLLEAPDELKVDVYTKYFFEDYFWYVENFVHIVSAIILFYSIFQYYLFDKIEKDKEYLELKLEVDTVNSTEVHPEDLENYLTEDFNKNRKIKQHVTNVTNEKAKINNKLVKNIDKNSKKKKEKLKKRLEKLDYKLTEEYLSEYVPSIKVRHFKPITSGFIFTGESKKIKSVDEYSEVKTDKEQLRKDGLKKIMLSILIVLSFASVVTLLAVDIENQTPIEIFTNALMKITPLLIQVKFGLDYSKSFMTEHLIPNLITRRNIILRFLKSIFNKERSDENAEVRN